MKIQSNAAEDLLNPNNLAFWSIFDEGQIGLLIISPDLHLLEMNEAFCLIMGYSKQELSRLTLKNITHPHYIEKDIESLNKLLKSN